MMKSVKIRNLTLGEGIPKICVPIMGESGKDVIRSVCNALEYRPDMIEWRIDFLRDVKNIEIVSALLRELRVFLAETPLLVTFRTKQEGGERELSEEEYRALYHGILETGMADAIDIELFLQAQTVAALIEEAHTAGTKVILSNHDFQKTPPKEELTARLLRMQELGGDIAKIAVMPEKRADVLTLLAATEEADRTLEIPVITMSMGAAGVASRLLGEPFGSALTFGMAGQASAPGQIPVDDLRILLKEIHKYS